MPTPHLPPLSVTLNPDPDHPHIRDVELHGADALRRYSTFECHVVLYPYSRDVRAAHLTFTPFEEYIHDITTRRRSLYGAIGTPGGALFGLLLGLAIFVGFLIADPDDLFSVQSIISVLGAYFIGKDLWGDIEDGFVAVTADRRLRYQKSYYLYRLEQNTTLTAYSALARERRHGRPSLLPDEMDFIQLSNSQTARMLFRSRRLRAFEGGVAHLLGIHVREALVEPFDRDGFMFGVKLGLGRRLGPLAVTAEFFQSLERGQRGCLHAGRWYPDAVSWRRVIILGNLRLYIGRGLLQGASMLGDASERARSAGA